MANFTELVKYQKSLGKGNIGSLGTSLGQKTLEKLDPRNYLFGRSDLAVTLFPSLKGYQAKTAAGKKITDTKTAEVSQFNAVTSDAIIRMDTNTKITAKNSLVLPMMARDMNLMRLNIQKLVRVSGETPSRKADMFFKRASERETMYETQYKRNAAVDTKTVRTEVKKEDEKKSFFESIFSFLPSIFKGLLVGGLIAALIGKLSENEEVKAFMKKAFTDVITGFFDAMKSGFEFLSEIFKDDKVQESIRNAFKSFFSMIGDLLSVKLFKVGDIDVTLGGAIAGVVGALIGLKVAIAAAASALMGLGGAGGVGGFLSTLTKGLGRVFGVVGAGMAGYEVGKIINEKYDLSGEAADFAMTVTGKNDEVARSLNPDASKSTLEKFSERSGDLAGAAGGATLGAAGVGAGVAKTASIIAKTPTATTSTSEALRAYYQKGSVGGHGINSETYNKISEIAKKVSKKTPSFIARFIERTGHKLGFKAAVFIGGLVASPVTGGISLLFSALSAALLIYSIYDIIKILGEIFDDLEEEQKQIEVEITSPELMTSENLSGQGEFDTGTRPVIESQKMKVTTIPKAEDDREMKKLKAQQKSALERIASEPTSAEEQRRMALSPTPTPTTPTRTETTTTAGTVEPYGGYKNREEFTRAMMPWAQKAAEELKVPAEAILSQWGLETAWGRKGAIQGQFNYGNIQGDYRESEPGLDAGRPRNFIKYNSMQDFVDDYVKQLKNPNPKGRKPYGIGQEQLTSQQFFEKLKKGGYAEDPNYVATLMNITKGTPNVSLAQTPAEQQRALALNKQGTPNVSLAQTPAEQQRALALNKPGEKKPTSLASLSLEDILSTDPNKMISNLQNLLPLAGPMGRKLGEELSGASKAVMAEKEQPATINLNNNQTNNNVSGNQQPFPVADASGVADPDFATILMRRSAEGALG